MKKEDSDALIEFFHNYMTLPKRKQRIIEQVLHGQLSFDEAFRIAEEMREPVKPNNSFKELETAIARSELPMMHFPVVLHTLRIYNGESLEEVADLLEVSSKDIAEYETGISEPDIYLLPILADHYGVTIDELLGRY